MQDNYKLEMLNSQIGNITEYLTYQNLTERKRKQLEYKLDELCTKRDYLENSLYYNQPTKKHYDTKIQASINKLIIGELIIYIVLCIYMLIKWG